MSWGILFTAYSLAFALVSQWPLISFAEKIGIFISQSPLLFISKISYVRRPSCPAMLEQPAYTGDTTNNAKTDRNNADRRRDPIPFTKTKVAQKHHQRIHRQPSDNGRVAQSPQFFLHDFPIDRRCQSLRSPTDVVQINRAIYPLRHFYKWIENQKLRQTQ